MPRQNNNKSNAKIQAKMLQLEKDKEKEREVSQMLLPVADDSYGTVALSHSDLTSKLIKRMLPYKTNGSQQFRYRGLALPITLLQSVTAPTTGALDIRLSNLPAAANLLTVFDQYKIMAIAVELSPTLTSQPNSQSVSIPRLTTAIDYDDANAQPSAFTIRQYDSCIVSPPGTGVVRTFIPHVADALYGGVAFTAYGNVESQWIDAASPGVPHFGLKYNIEQGLSNQVVLQAYQVDIVYFVAFRNVF